MLFCPVMENSSYRLILEMNAKPEERSILWEKAKIYNSARNEYEAAVNRAAVNIVVKDSGLILQQGI